MGPWPVKQRKKINSGLVKAGWTVLIMTYIHSSNLQAICRSASNNVASDLESLCGGQIALSTLLIKPNTCEPLQVSVWSSHNFIQTCIEWHLHCQGLLDY